MFGNFLKTLGIELAITLLPALVRFLNGEIRAKIVHFAGRWYEKSETSPTRADDLASALIKDLVSLVMNQEQPDFVLDDEIREAALALYAGAKKTDNPFDDMVVAILFAILNLPTPAEAA